MEKALSFLQAKTTKLGQFLRYGLSSLVAVGIDNLVFFILIQMGLNALYSLIGARIASTIVNFTLLRNIVFEKSGSRWAAFVRYIGLVIFSGSIVWGVIQIGGKANIMHPLGWKLSAETIMFVFNFIVSKTLIFRKR